MKTMEGNFLNPWKENRFQKVITIQLIPMSRIHVVHITYKSLCGMLLLPVAR